MYKAGSGLDLGKGPILPLLLKMSWPSMAAMLVAAVYNLMDTLWLARISPHAIAAFTITFPIQMIFASIGIGTGIGAGSYASRMFGTGEYEKAQQTAGQVFPVTLFFAVLIISATVLFPDPILRFFGATEEILPLSRRYLTIVVWSSPFLFFMMMVNNLLRAEGQPNLSMTVIIAFAGIGALLDPLLILGWGPFPRLEIAGAAIAAVIAQFTGAALSLHFLFHPASKYRLRRHHLRPRLPIILSIYQTGFPSVIMNIVVSAVIIVFNHTLAAFGPLAIATLGIVFRVNGVVMMVLFGIGHGVMPMVGFSEGAKAYGRLLETIRVAVRVSTFFAAVCCLLLEIFAVPIVTLFSDNAQMLAIGLPAIRIFVSMLVLIAPTLVWINMFLGLGKGIVSMSLMFIRDVFVLIPCLLILPHYFGLNGIWMAQPVSNGLAFFIIYFWSRRELRRIADLRMKTDAA
jgi:putative MATE family efflux protein